VNLTTIFAVLLDAGDYAGEAAGCAP
jgi:hypothetical protein